MAKIRQDGGGESTDTLSVDRRMALELCSATGDPATQPVQTESGKCLKSASDVDKALGLAWSLVLIEHVSLRSCMIVNTNALMNDDQKNLTPCWSSVPKT